MRRGLALLAAWALALGAGACGGGERQDADEPEGEYRLEVVDAKFPASQALAQRSSLTIGIRNADSRTVPNVAVTIQTEPEQPGGAPGAFAQNREDVTLADPGRPVWVIDSGPEGGETAYTNTWALGKLDPGQTKTFEWRVTAVKAGNYTIGYQVAPGLDGKARLASGSRADGRFRVSIDDTPPEARVAQDGETVVREKPDSE